MSTGITYDVTNHISGPLRALQTGLGGDRSGLNEAIGIEELALFRNHLIALAESRHGTANALGATPSGHLAQAAEKTTMRSDASGATITITQPGMRRAFGDVDIFPGPGKKALTIPLTAEAYNRRAIGMVGLFAIRSKEGKGLLVRKDGAGGLVALYLLVSSVHQKQDRTLLPSDEEIITAAKIGARNYVDYLLLNAGGRN